jgi:hypothetical protein
MTKPQMLEAALKVHAVNPGAWLETDIELTEISDVVRDPAKVNDPDYRPSSHPKRYGRVWWRTHNLVRQLGGVALVRDGKTV